MKVRNLWSWRNVVVHDLKLVLISVLLLKANGCEFCDNNNPGIGPNDIECGELAKDEFKKSIENWGAVNPEDIKSPKCLTSCLKECKDICKDGVILQCPITTTLIVIIVMVVLLVLAIGACVACYLIRKKRRGADGGGYVAGYGDAVPGYSTAPVQPPPSTLSATLNTVQGHRSQLGYGAPGGGGGMSSMIQQNQFNRMQSRPPAEPQPATENQALSSAS